MNRRAEDVVRQEMKVAALHGTALHRSTAKGSETMMADETEYDRGTRGTQIGNQRIMS